MDIESLERYGFKEWPVKPNWDHHDRHWQFCKKDEHGKRFYVQVRFWKHSRYSRPDNPVEDGFDAWAQFDTSSPSKPTFNVELPCQQMTPEQVVCWFNDLWEKLGCCSYEKWGD